jgi:ribonucleotide reductase beta subunit family protein with ferritin-like domain
MNKYSFLPIQNRTIYDLYKKAEGAIWTVDRLENIKAEATCYENLVSCKKTPLTYILAIFSQVDGIVLENLIDEMKEQVGDLIKEAKHFYAVQIFMETVHNHTYSLLIDAYISDEKEKEKILNSILNFRVVGNISNWCFKWMAESNKLLERIVAFCCVEGIIFSSAFAYIFYLKNIQEKLKVLFLSNDYIARDEGQHTKFGVVIYRELVKTCGLQALDEPTVHSIVREAVALNDDFLEEAFIEPIPDLKIEELKQYVRKCADFIVLGLGYKKIYNVENPFIWMNLLGLDSKENFFEVHTTNYTSNSNELINFDDSDL